MPAMKASRPYTETVVDLLKAYPDFAAVYSAPTCSTFRTVV